MQTRLQQLTDEWLHYFEKAFDSDWDYTRSNLRVGEFSDCIPKTAEEKQREIEQSLQQLGDLVDRLGIRIEPAVAAEAAETFLTMTGDYAYQDWHNAEQLVRLYRTLRPLLDQQEPVPADPHLSELIRCFEVVFDSDWKHTRAMLGIGTHSMDTVTEAAAKECEDRKARFIEIYGRDSLAFEKDRQSHPGPAGAAPFLNPRCDLTGYWPQAAALLRAYRQFKSHRQTERD